jgi:regulator of protease activity HflC (stomatin/prohibitin superfamily)
MPFFFSVVPEYKRLVHFRFGKLAGKGEKGPGFIFPLWPIIDQVVVADLREDVLDVEPQTCITKDNAPVSVDMLVYLKVVQPVESVVKVENFMWAARGMAVTTLRAVVGDISLDDVLAKRDEINATMQIKLDQVTDRWGVKVMAVEIREITPPRDIQDAMSRQMSAERNRRAAVLDADGQRQAAITVAEGTKQAAILEAEGFANALTKINEVAQGVDPNTMGLQYLDMMKGLASSEASKWIVPSELTQFISSFAQNAGRSGDGQQ